MSIGENIKKWREARNLKQSELAELIGISDKTVSSWERNRTEPKMGMIENICIALHCKKTDIIGGNESEDSKINSPSSITLSELEQKIIIAYRKADEFDQTTVLRALHIDDIDKKESTVAG